MQTVYALISSVSFHLWMFSVAIFYWLRTHGPSSMNKSSGFPKHAQAANIIFAVIGIAMDLSLSLIEDQDLVHRLSAASAVIISLVSLLSSIAILVSSRTLKRYLIETAERVGRQYDTEIVRKSKFVGLGIPLCFSVYSAVILTAVFQRDFYEKAHGFLHSVVTASDFVSFFFVIYLNTESKEQMERATMSAIHVQHAAESLIANKQKRTSSMFRGRAIRGSGIRGRATERAAGILAMEISSTEMTDDDEAAKSDSEPRIAAFLKT